MIYKFWHWLLLPLLLFLLPWQTRWMYDQNFLNYSYWEYGSASWYGTEILLWIIIILFAIDRFWKPFFNPRLGGVGVGWLFRRRNFYFALIFLVFLGAEVLHSIDVGLSLNFIFLLLEGLCFFLVILNFDPPSPRLRRAGKPNQLLLAFWSGGVVQALLGSYQFFTQNISANKWFGLAAQATNQPGSFVIDSGAERWLRAYGSFGSPNILGGYLAVIFILGLILYINQPTPAYRTGRPTPHHFGGQAPKRGLLKIFLTLGQAIILTGLILSFSRSAFLAVLFAWVLIGMFLLVKKFNFFNRLHLIGMYIKQSIFYLLVFAVLFYNFEFLFIARLNFSNHLENVSVSERAEQYSDSANFFRQHPLLGVGPGAYTLALFRANPSLLGYSYQPVHNIYVLILTEWGILGAIVWLAVFGRLILLVRARNPELLPVLIMPFVIGAFDHYWWSLYIGIILWWVVLGLCIRNNSEAS